MVLRCSMRFESRWDVADKHHKTTLSVVKVNFLSRRECQPLIISAEATIEDALKKIDENSGAPCLVLDGLGRCIDLLTDGDLRRLLLNKHSITKTLSPIIDGYVETAVGLSEHAAREQMKKKQLRYLPVTDENGVLSGLWTLGGAVVESNVGSVLILAGGEGKRLRPITRKVPKPLVPVGGLSLLDRSIDACVSYGVKDIFVSVNYLADQIIQHLATFPRDDVNVTVLREDEPLGTAGPIGLVEIPPNEPLIIINGDLLHKVNIARMKEHFVSDESDLLIGSRLYELSVPFGVLETDGATVTGITEKPVLGFPVSAGIYVVGQRVRDLVRDARKIDMPDLIHEAIESGLAVDLHMIHEFWLDVGTPEALQIAQQVVQSDDY